MNNKLFIDTITNKEQEVFSLNCMLTIIKKNNCEKLQQKILNESHDQICNYHNNKRHHCVFFYKSISCYLSKLDDIKTID